MDYAVILAGGVGERFWPASTPARPKQLLPLLSDRTMLRETLDRLDGIVPPERRFIWTNASLVDAVRREAPEVPAAHVVGEPEGKNTAPAIGLAAGLLAARDPAAVLLVLPADHAIGNPAAFRETAREALDLAAEREVLVLFGIVPSRPETGYGYVRRGGSPVPDAAEAYRVERFVEKPDAETARRLWQDGDHYWNSGLFCGSAATFLDEYGRHLPLMRRAVDAAVEEWDADPAAALARFTATVESTSVDVGIMQRTERAVILPAAGWGWDDVGSWEALARWTPVTDDGNVMVGRCALERCANVIAFSDGGRVSALGMRDCVIVRTADETLVVARDALDGLREFVRGLAPALVLLGLLACAPAYREAPPPPAAGNAGEPAGNAGDPVTIVGTVGADGTLRADTLAGARPDTTRVERETVLTGAVRAAGGGMPERLVTGYRVQVFAAVDRPAAAAIATRVQERLGGPPVYVEWDDPWHKVRVGDFDTREAAEPLRLRLIELGYPEAWTVQTTIRTVP